MKKKGERNTGEGRKKYAISTAFTVHSNTSKPIRSSKSSRRVLHNYTHLKQKRILSNHPDEPAAQLREPNVSHIDPTYHDTSSTAAVITTAATASAMINTIYVIQPQG
jgi:hypothetical protein